MKFSKDEFAYLAAVKSDLKVFAKHAFATVYPGKDFLENWHIDAVIYQLELAFSGKRPRLIVNMPPRHVKSFLVSVVFPAFLLGQDPTVKIVCASYAEDLAASLAMDFRRIVESDWYKAIFPNVVLTKVTENKIATAFGGYRYATTVDGTLTGIGADVAIIDDPLKPEEAMSDKKREKVNNWYASTLYQRLEDKEKSLLIIVMQRLHVNDLTGFVEQGGGYHKLSLPAIALKNEYIETSDFEDYGRPIGEALHEERESLEVLEKIRDQIGTYNFISQYQQTPESPEGGLIKLKWLNRIQEYPEMDPYGMITVSIDSALSTSETANYSAISLMYSVREGHNVLSAERGRWTYEQLKARALKYIDKYGKDIHFIIEFAGNGISLQQYLREAGYRSHYYAPRLDKITRVAFMLPLIESGRLSILDKEGENGWVQDYVNELVTFPNGKYDDQVDSLMQALHFAEKRVNPKGKMYVFGYRGTSLEQMGLD